MPEESKPTPQPQPKPLRETWKPVADAGGADHSNPPPPPLPGDNETKK